MISSPANPRVKELVALRRRRIRRERGVTLVDGYEEALLAVDAGAAVRALYYCPELLPAGAMDLVTRLRLAGHDCVELGRAAFEKAAYRQGPDGVLLVTGEIPDLLQSLELGQDPLLLLAEGIEKPGNIGAMLRTADAAGVAGVIGVDLVTDWSNPNVVRASKGTVFSVPVASASASDAVAFCSDRGIRLVVGTPEADTRYTDADLTGPLAIVAGTEKAGVTRYLKDRADLLVTIPMAGTVNSLNVAAAAGILLYESVRQRAARSDPFSA